MRLWIGTALLAGSWLLGLDYFYPASPWAWAAVVVAAVVLLSKSSGARTVSAGATVGVNGSLEDSVGVPAEPSASADGYCSWDGKHDAIGSCRICSLECISLVLLLPVVWYAAWPYRAAPLLIVLGLAIRWLPVRLRWAEGLARGTVTAGVMMFVQALVLELYAGLTARSHDLPWPLPDMLANVAGMLGIDAAANGSTVAMHSMRQLHRFAATWDLLLDPASLLFFIGGATMLLLHRNDQYGMIGDECRPDVSMAGGEGDARSSFFRAVRTLAIIMVVWLPLRAGLMLAIYLQRVLRSDPDQPLHVMNHVFSPWMLLLLLVPPVLLAWRFVRIGRTPPKAKNEATGEEPQVLAAKEAHAVAIPPSEVFAPPSEPEIPAVPPVPTPPSPFALPMAAGLIALAAALLTAAIEWDPIGARREGRVMVVERHSEWEPTTKPYDTTWFAEPPLFGEASGYNYAAIYDYLGQYYTMSRLLEKDKIDDDTLDKCDVLIVKIPTARYSKDEAEAVTRFVERGGGLLLIGDHTNYEGSGTAMNDITRPMGFTFRDDLLFTFRDPPDEQHYVPATPPHPIVQHMPPMDFAVSCSIDPGSSRGRAVIAPTGLWSMGPEYHHDNFMPYTQHCPEMRYGPFIQVWAARHGQGRAVAFTDSTIFSNFCTFQPGKAELMVGMVEWLNHGNCPFHARLWLGLVGMASLAGGFWMLRNSLPSPDQPSVGARRAAGGEGGETTLAEAAPAIPEALTLALSGHRPKVGRERGPDSTWLLLLAAVAFGWVVASVGVAAAHRWAMPAPEVVRPMQRVVIDRTTSTVQLAQGLFPHGDDEGYGMLEASIPRLGCYTVREKGSNAFSGDALVVICPSEPVTPEFREHLTQYVADGGKLLVIDTPENGDSTANDLLSPFGLSIDHEKAWQGTLSSTALLPAVEIAGANEVTGAEPLASLGKRPVAAAMKYKKGSVMAVGFGSLWNDKRMGEHWMMEPDAAAKARYDVLFALLRSLLDDKPLPTPPSQPVKKPHPELPIKESGPAEL